MQKLFAKHLIRNRNLIACHEVSHYGHICDVLAVDRNKKLIFEYEFKNSSQDLKVAEFTKEKYKPYRCTYGNEIAKSRHWKNVYKQWRHPHYFYFVVPESLFQKEEKFLRSLSVGTISYKENKTFSAHIAETDFYVSKRTVEHKSNPQDYYVALKNITKRFANLYAW